MHVKQIYFKLLSFSFKSIYSPEAKMGELETEYFELYPSFCRPSIEVQHVT